MEGGKKKETPSIPPTRPEKRRSLRSPILVMRVKGETENNIFFGYAKNISRGGMFISTVNPREVGETFTIEFTFPKEKTPIRCRCSVVWRRGYDPHSYYEPGMGIRFLDIEKDKMQKIEDWVNQRT